MSLADSRDDILVSVDGEFTGRLPGIHSMISFGAVAYRHTGEELSRFRVNLRELEGGLRDPETMEWWAEHAEAWELSTIEPQEIRAGMQDFADWLNRLPGRPKLMGWPLPVDFQFIYWYYIRFLDRLPPFGFDGIDIKTYAMAKFDLDQLSHVSKALVCEALGVNAEPLSHDPVDDAARQGEIYFALRAMPRA